MAVGSLPEVELPAELAHPLMLIGGERVEAASGARMDVENPSRRETLASIPCGSGEDCDRAVRAAAEAFPAWARMAPRQRGARLLEAADAIAARSEELAYVCSAETGNALRTQSRPEAAQAVDVLRFFGSAAAAAEQKGQVLALGERVHAYTRPEPLGVVAAIIPWNSPMALAGVKLAMALSTGNTVVLKPAEVAPLAVLLLGEILAETLPTGVVNVLTGTGEEAGAALLTHPKIAKITFTGSTDVGRLAMHAAAERILPVTLELGGKSPVIVFPDSDDDATVEGVVNAMRFTRQGQSCTSGSRLFVHEDIFDGFLERLAVRLGEFKIGDALDEASDIGSLASQAQYDKVINYLGEAFHAGVKPVVGGIPSNGAYRGYQLDPTVLVKVAEGSPLMREEIFGPVLIASPWRDEDEVLGAANDSDYGLSGYVFTRDVDRALRVAHGLEVGLVQVNQGGGPGSGISFGGKKQSGLGNEYTIEDALAAFTQRKCVVMRVAESG